MATSTETSNPVSNKYEKYLEERIEQTAKQVKWVELLSFFLILSIFVFGLLFLLCIVDAWIVELQVWMRWSALAFLAVGSIGLVFYKAFPFFWRKVNPLYAAKKLEEGRPELKNSVINYLTVDKNSKRKSTQAVQQKMSQAAATDVANIPIDVTVDRSNMIMAGYLLAGIIAVFAFYKIFSPKDPFQTISRVILPSANLMAPARVRITDIQPGDAKKYFGESIEISARIKGLQENESARILITSESGTRKDFALAMNRQDDSSIYKVNIGEENGLQESFSYRVEAGDARSVQHFVEVRTCPTIFVEEIAYAPPAYTGVPQRIDENPELISGVEGSVATLTARTNLPIEAAYLQLFREVKKADSSKSVEPKLEIAKSVRLDNVDDFSATCDLVLELNAKRSAQRFTHYQLIFTTQEGDKSENPNLTRIEIVADIKPEVEVISPREKAIQIPQNQTERLELAAVDPDYGLTAIAIVGENKGTRLFEKVVFQSDSVRGAKGKQTAELPFRPDQFGLKAGDEVIWFARAEDNRAVGPDQVLVPNRTRTENYKIVVTAPIEKGSGTDPQKDEQPKDDKNDPSKDDNQPPQKDPKKNQPKDAQDPKNGKSQSPEKNQKGKGGDENQKQSPQKSDDNNQKKDDPKNSDSKNSKSGKSDQNDPNKNDPNRDDSNKNKSGKQDGSDEKQQPKDGKDGDGKEKKGGGSSQKKSDPKQSQKSSGNQDGKSGKNKQSTQNNSGKNDGKNDPSKSSQTGDSNADPKSSQNGTDSKGNRGARDPNENPSNADNELTNSKREPGDDSDQTNQKPQNSKEAFEKIKDYFDKKKKEQEDNNQSPNDNKNDNSQPEKNPGQSDSKQSKKSPGKSDSDNSDPKNGKQETPKKSETGSGQSGKDKNKKNAAKNDSDSKKNSPDPSKGDNSQNKKEPGSDPNKAKKSSGGSTQEGKKKQESPGKSNNDDAKSSGSKDDPNKNKSDAKGNGDKKNSPKNDKSGSKKNKGPGKTGDNDSTDKKSTNEDSKGNDLNKGSKKNNDPSGNKKDGSDRSKKSGNEKGDDPKSNQKNKSGDKTGDKKGASKNGEKGKQADSKNGKQKSGNQDSDSNQPKNNSGGDTGNVDSAKNKSGNERQDQNSNSNDGSTGQASQADKANLDYTRKTTEMVLEKLKDQKDKPDKDLLKDLNWTEDELKNFQQKWEAMRQKAKSGSQKDRNRFDDALKSLGLKDPKNKLAGANLKNDDKSGYRQKSGTRKVPSDFAKKFRAIQKSQRKLDENE